MLLLAALSLSACATPEPPAPSSPGAREFVFSFPDNGSSLTPQTRGEATSIANFAKSHHAKTVLVVTTDYVDPSADVAAALRRALLQTKAVADAIVAQGVPGSVVRVDWNIKRVTQAQTPNNRVTVDVKF
jgi:hypothetical protein